MQPLTIRITDKTKRLLRPIPFIATFFLTSCATILTGTKQKVSFTSIPSGAKLQVNGIDRGTTPLTVKLKKGHTGQVVTLSVKGYETKTFQPETNFNAVTLVNIFVFPCFGIDLLTGAMWKYHPKQYNVELTKAQ